MYYSFPSTHYGATLKKVEVSQHSKYFCEFYGKVIHSPLSCSLSFFISFYAHGSMTVRFCLWMY
ncbi:hypothetical protein CICLE_v10029778mg [Citrus x clementina]|uniref:Uncharacterized protein n=1 Tax=Citrus clementina TaxID=85681 RepID=V4RQ07_CITCL|nr:hypothetical protein CICLE_v10029778mg [Citrus x clementina]